MNSSNIALYCMVGLFGVLLIVNVALAFTVIFKMRGRGETSTHRLNWNRPFLRGWHFPDLRLYMIGWTLAGSVLSVVFCIMMVMILRM